MIQIYNNPLLLDFITIALAMPEDERAQLEALTGEKFDVDGCAVGNFTVPGPKWVIKENETALCVGGFAPQRPGVWRDFMLTTPAAWESHWFPVTRVCRHAMDSMFSSKQAHRLECIVPARRLASRSELARWYKILGYKNEATLAGYCADGTDAVMFARVGH